MSAIEEKSAPSIIFVAGDVSLLRKGLKVSVIGSRNASREGLARTRKLSRYLATRKITLVSGLARGIDTAAHWSTLEAGGYTIAVVGTALDVTYPDENKNLAERIKAQHLMVSQFPPKTAIQEKNFTMRNRLMSLISDATIIVEAADNSGTVNHGWEAIKLGRPVYILESAVKNKSVWHNKFLKYGAKILSDESIDEIFTTLPVQEEQNQ